MIDKYSGLSYDSFEVIENDLYGNWYNKLQMYDKFRDGENLYFDLDMIIYNKLPNLIRKDFTLLNDTWWRESAHTPLNSSIVSWTGDVSHIWNKFKSNITPKLDAKINAFSNSKDNILKNIDMIMSENKLILDNIKLSI